ncbi:MAG: anthranilate synthase component II, partial [Candidatus Marinamargulisbacteria bacterium]
MILVIDNYDSFTYNLVQYIGAFESNVKVVRNDAVSVDTLATWDIQKIVISPGPGRPSGAGISLDVIRSFYKTIPILGVCLGHQAIGEAFGGTTTYATQIMHGRVSSVTHNEVGIYRGIPNPFDATRYHSLVIDPHHFPSN